MSLSVESSEGWSTRIAVVIPAYRVKRHISKVILDIPAMVWRIYVVDDACPEGSGKYVEQTNKDQRVEVIYHKTNQGVGGAVMTGYRAAILEGAEIIVKVDGDGQMDVGMIPHIVDPIICGEADYTKGNRFYDLEEIRNMPSVRLFGNAVLSFMTKISSGYWNLFDPTNGYTAIHTDVARHLPFNKISKSYFFETDILFRLNTLRAVVVDVPIDARYGEEKSGLKITRILAEFIYKHTRNLTKRIFYNYYLRDLSIASIELPLGILMFFFGIIFGLYHWSVSAKMGVPTPVGTIMLSAMPILMGLQLILAFISYDIASVPSRPFHRRYSRYLKNDG